MLNFSRVPKINCLNLRESELCKRFRERIRERLNISKTDHQRNHQDHRAAGSGSSSQILKTTTSTRVDSCHTRSTHSPLSSWSLTHGIHPNTSSEMATMASIVWIDTDSDEDDHHHPHHDNHLDVLFHSAAHAATRLYVSLLKLSSHVSG